MLLSIASVSLRLSESCRDGNVTPLVASAYIRVRPRRDERRHCRVVCGLCGALVSRLWGCTVWIHCVVRRDPRDELQMYRRCGMSMSPPPQISGFAQLLVTVHRRMCEDPSILISLAWSVVREMDATGARRAAINQTCDATEKTCNGLLRKATRCTSSDASRRARPPRAPSSPCSAHQRATRAEPAAAPRRRVVWAAGAPAGVCAGGFGIHKRLWHDAPAAIGPLLAPQGSGRLQHPNCQHLQSWDRHGGGQDVDYSVRRSNASVRVRYRSQRRREPALSY